MKGVNNGETGVGVHSLSYLCNFTVNLKLFSNKKLIFFKSGGKKAVFTSLMFKGKTKFNLYSKNQLTELFCVSELPKVYPLKLLHSFT